MKKNNKGFTLVELLIVVVILGLVMGAVATFMIIGSRMFKKGNADANIQRESQLVINQIADMIIDSTGGVEFKETADVKELILYNIVDGKNTKESVKWTKNDKKISYSKWIVEFNDSSKSFEPVETIADNELLAEDVTDFYADITDTRDEYNKEGDLVKVVQSVQLKAGYEDENGQVSYETTPLITIRNRLISANAKMIYEEPERIVKTLKVDAELDDFKVRDGYWDLYIKLLGTVHQTGHEAGVIKYKWTVDNPLVEITTDDTQLDVCRAYVNATNLPSLRDKTITFTLTGDNQDGLVSTDTVVIDIPSDNNGYKYERGVVDGRDEFYIKDHVNYDAFDPKVHFFDADKVEIVGAQYDYLSKFIQIEYNSRVSGDKKIFDDFKLIIKPGLDRTKSIYIRVDMTLRNTYKPEDSFAYSREMYIPAVAIHTKNPTNKWPTPISQGFASKGNGTKHEFLMTFTEEGYLREQFRDDKVGYLTNPQGGYAFKPNKDNIIEGLPDDYSILLVPTDFRQTGGEGTDPLDNTQMMTFELRIIDKDGNIVTADEGNLKIDKVKVKQLAIRVNVENDLYDRAANGGKGELKPCPNCGKKLKLTYDDVTKTRSIECTKCSYSVPLIGANIIMEFEHQNANKPATP